jgi:hypothetical protein
MGAAGIVSTLSTAVRSGVSVPPLSFYVLIGGLFIVFVLGLLVRAWFDLAQTRIVDREERSVVAVSLRALPSVLRHSPVLLWAYLRIAVVIAAISFFAIWIWLHLPHSAIGRSFVTLEFLVALSLLMRLWQRATAITWYQRYMPFVAPEFASASVHVTPEETSGSPHPEGVSAESPAPAPAAPTETNHSPM